MRNIVRWLPIASGFLVLVLSLAVAVLTVNGRKGELATGQNLATRAAAEPGSLALSPAGGDFSVGAEVPVGIVIDSGGRSADGADVIINFDPKAIQVVGTAVTTAPVFQQYPVNSVDNTKGEVRLSGLTFDPKPLAGIMGSFRIKAVKSGPAALSVRFEEGSTTESTIAEHGSAMNILGTVINASYNFK